MADLDLKHFLEMIGASAAVINLQSRPDRLRRILPEIVKLDIPYRVKSVIRPVDGGIYGNAGIRGCAESHIALLKEAAAAGNRPLLVMEDDFQLCDDFPGLSATYHGLIHDCIHDLDLVYYYNHNCSRKNTHVSCVAVPTVGTHFYIAVDPRRVLAACAGALQIDLMFMRAITTGTLRSVSPTRQLVTQDLGLGTDIDADPGYLQKRLQAFNGVYIEEPLTPSGTPRHA